MRELDVREGYVLQWRRRMWMVRVSWKRRGRLVDVSTVGVFTVVFEWSPCE